MSNLGHGRGRRVHPNKDTKIMQPMASNTAPSMKVKSFRELMEEKKKFLLQKKNDTETENSIEDEGSSNNSSTVTSAPTASSSSSSSSSIAANLANPPSSTFSPSLSSLPSSSKSTSGSGSIALPRTTSNFTNSSLTKSSATPTASLGVESSASPELPSSQVALPSSEPNFTLSPALTSASSSLANMCSTEEVAPPQLQTTQPSEPASPSLAFDLQKKIDLGPKSVEDMDIETISKDETSMVDDELLDLENEVRSFLDDSLRQQLDNDIATTTPNLKIEEELNALKVTLHKLQENSLSLHNIKDSYMMKEIDWSKQISLMEQIEAKLRGS